jgi:hypothetical protein
VTEQQAMHIARLCAGRPGLSEHGRAIRIALARGRDAQAELGDTWAAAQAIASYAEAHGFAEDGEAAQRIADLLAADAEGRAMPRWSDL